MKSITVIIFCTVILYSATGQPEQNTFTGKFDQTPLTEVLDQIESQSVYVFCFEKSWLDSIKVTQTFQAEAMEDALKKIFTGTHLNYVLVDEQIILTYQNPIVTSLGIKGFYNSQTEKIDSKKGLIFSREYLNTIKGDIEDQVFEIGDRNQLSQKDRSTIAGYIREKETNNPIEGAFVYLESPFIGTSTDADGFYSVTIPNGKQRLVYQSVGFKNTFRNVVLFSDGMLNASMEIDVIALNTVTVNAERDINIERAQMGVTRINIKDTRNLPALLGERDIMKAAATTSGVQTVGEGSSGINIRGGKADQNLFLMDGATIYNTSHFFGFFSVFNSEAIDGIELYKGGIPAKYGGRLSSVLDISSKKPNKEKISGSGGLGPVTSRLLFEVPIIKNKTSIMAGVRGTYSDFVMNRVKKSPLGNNEASFYDIIGKIDHEINEKDNLSASAYYSFDSFQLSSDSLLSYSNFSYSNSNFSLKWKHRFNDRFNGELTATGSRYNYDIGYNEIPSQAFNIGFDISELSVSADIDYYINEKKNFNFGFNTKRYEVNPGLKKPVGNESSIRYDHINSEQAIESSFYFSNKFDPTDRLSLTGGIRYSIFTALGENDVYQYIDGEPLHSESRIDTTHYGKGQAIATYHGPEIRFSGRYTLNKLSSVKMSYNRTRQYIHQLLNSASVAPTDIWRLSGNYLAPQISDQFSIGYYKNLIAKNVIEVSAEIYFKKLQNLIDFKVGSESQFNKAIETDLLQGDGKSYGAELSIKKNDGWFTGWINYTFSRTLIRLDGKFPEEIINKGAYYPTSYDKPHYLNVITNYKFTRRYSMSLNLIYASGRPITYPAGKWNFQGFENLHYSDRNSFRIPDYFRIDAGINIEGNHKIKKLAHSFWTFSIYNVFGRDNVYSIFFKVKNGELDGYKMTVFKDPIPTITYNFSF